MIRREIQPRHAAVCARHSFPRTRPRAARPIHVVARSILGAAPVGQRSLVGRRVVEIAQRVAVDSLGCVDGDGAGEGFGLELDS